MKITYITTYDANELSNWSGLGYYIAQSLLKQENELEFLGKLERKISPALFLKAIYYRKIVQQGFPLDRSPHVIKAYARQIARRLNYHTDLLFSPGSIPIALLETKKPKVFYTDATFAGMLGFYAAYSNLSKEATRNGNMLEQQALDSAALAIYSSDWAAQSAIRDYNANPDKVKVVPFGANLDTAFSYETIKSILLNRSQTTCHLLFIAVDWERKGGDIAVHTGL